MDAHQQYAVLCGVGLLDKGSGRRLPLFSRGSDSRNDLRRRRFHTPGLARDLLASDPDGEFAAVALDERSVDAERLLK